MSGSIKVAKRELAAADRHLRSMHECDTFEDMDREWRGFLVSIEKVWKKAERYGVSVNQGRFSQFQKPYKEFKKNSHLLSYILQARNSDEHSIQEVVETKTNYSVIPLGFMERTMNEPDRFIPINPGGKPMLTMPIKFELKAIENRGEVYQPPWSENKVTGIMSPIEAATEALHFYTEYMTKIETDFLSASK
ncbi:hypothetical protein [Grimontia hollisae]|uniref:hypothetical protein n=1 Tax=Grimontia hollisae TaxID=673 RepID=UPI00165E42AB|nr:hypothetical protein [Grimontia hollisae]